MLSGCTDSGSGQRSSADSSPAPVGHTRTYVFECPGEFSFVARAEPGKAWVFLPGDTLGLPQVPSDSGTQYTDGKYRLNIYDHVASLETGNGRYDGCRNNRARAIWEHAKLNGVDFRATGNEPGWYLEISNRTDILIVADYGQSRHRFASATVSSEPHNRTTVYSARNDGDLVEITITAGACRDSMSGEAFSAKVSVRLNDTDYQGCGRALH